MKKRKTKQLEFIFDLTIMSDLLSTYAYYRCQVPQLDQNHTYLIIYSLCSVNNDYLHSRYIEPYHPFLFDISQYDHEQLFKLLQPYYNDVIGNCDHLHELVNKIHLTVTTGHSNSRHQSGSCVFLKIDIEPLPENNAVSNFIFNFHGVTIDKLRHQMEIFDQLINQQLIDTNLNFEDLSEIIMTINHIISQYHNVSVDQIVTLVKNHLTAP